MWGGVEVSWGPIWHLGGSLMSLPPVPPAPFCPRVWRLGWKCNTSWTGGARASSRREQKLCCATKDATGQLWHTVSSCEWLWMGPGSTNTNTLQANTLQLDLSLHLRLRGVYKSLYLCLRTHSPCPSYIPKEAITSLASASPWAVVIVTCGLVDMTTPPWSRDRW